MKGTQFVWNIPYQRNLYFTGREDILQSLYDSLAVNMTAALTEPQSINGLGGIGKTQTAVEYAYRYQNDYQAILWVRADSRTILVSDLVTIADLLNLPEKDEHDQSLIVAAVIRWLKDHSHWLLILDNLEDLTLAKEFIPVAYRGHILLTSRAQALGDFAQGIRLEKMSPEVGALFLLRRAAIIALSDELAEASFVDRTKAVEISYAMDGLPLALDQAGEYIEETGCGLKGYLDLYQKHQIQLLKARGNHITNYPASVATTWSLSFEKVATANQSAAALLQFCAFLYPDAIPEEIITEVASHLGPALQSVANDPLELNIALKELRRFSLIQRSPDEKTLSVHRLVQTVLKDEMDETIQGQWAERAVRAVDQVFTDVEFKTWSRCQRCLPHAQVCATLIDQWKMEFAEATRLLNQAGYYLWERAQYTDAEMFYRKALALREQVLGPKHIYVAISLNNMAVLYDALANYDQAEPLYLRAIEIYERVLVLQ